MMTTPTPTPEPKAVLWGEIWHYETDPPKLCAACEQTDHTEHEQFFNWASDGTVYGPFCCDCLCDPVNVEALMDTDDE